MKNWATSYAVHPDDLPRVIDAWRRSIETGKPHDLELRQRRFDGVYRWFHSRALPARDTEGRITGWYMLLTDIDDRKRAEGELTRAFDDVAKSEAELRTIIDAIPQLIIAIGTDKNFLSANQAVLEYTGLTKEELGSERFREVFHPEIPKDCATNAHAGFATAVRQVSNGAIARQPRFPSKRRLYSVDETGGVPLSMKV